MRAPERCLIFDPYLLTMGGGEHFVFELARVLSRRYDVVVAAPRLPSQASLAAFGVPGGMQFRRLPWWRFPIASAKYDLSVYVTLRLPLPACSGTRVVLVQFPFTSLSSKRLLRHAQEVVVRRSTVLTYSNFAAAWVARRWDTSAVVVPPPVRLGVPSRPKERIGLSVGRFFPQQHSKRQDVLVEVVRRLPPAVREGWTFVFAGGLSDDPAARRFFSRVQEASVGLPIDLRPNLPRSELESLYARASIYWHATGFGRDKGQPEDAEHFGITTVEAMSYGVIPIVYEDGGQAEIARHGGVLTWRTIDECVDLTVGVMLDDAYRSSVAAAAVEASRRYGVSEFERNVASLFL